VSRSAAGGQEADGLNASAGPAPDSTNLPTEQSARETLRALAQSHIARLNHRLEQLWLESDAAQFTEAATAPAPDTSPEAALRQRYLAAATRDLHRAFNLLDRGRKSARLWTSTHATPDSEPTPAPAPNEPKPLAVPTRAT
jgi:hypothetical protein